MAGVRETSILAELDLFQGLSQKQLAWVGERLHTKTFPSGASLMTAEQPGQVVYIILHGTVKIHIEQADGTDVILAFLGKGDTVGEMSLLDSVGRSASAVTLEDTSFIWMDDKTFQEALQMIPSLALNLVRILSARVRLANGLIQALATLDVYGRVARQLLAFAEKYGETGLQGDTTISIHLTQRDIADLVGASRKRVNQVMVAFKQHNYIYANECGQVVVHDRKALAHFADQQRTFPSTKE